MLRFGFVFAVVCVLLANASYDDQPLYQIVELSKPIKGLYVSGPVDVYFVEASPSDACRIEARGSFDNKTFTVLHADVNQSEPMIQIHVQPFKSERVETIVVYHENELSTLAFSTSGRVETIGRGIVKADDELVNLRIDDGKNFTLKFDVNALQANVTRADSVQLMGTIRDTAIFLVADTSFVDAANLTIKNAEVEAESGGVVEVSATVELKMKADSFSKIHYRLPNGTEPSDVQAEPGAEIRRIF